MRNKINTPHDRFFKTMMAKPDVNREFLIANLPSNILEIIDLDTIKFHKESFIDQQLQLNMIDVLVETKFNGLPGYIYVLVEHQSKPDKIMPLRIWSYMLKIMEYHITHNKTDKLPVVYPIIFYNGKRNYSYSTNLLDLFANKELAKRILGELSPIHLTELNKISDDELARSTSYCALALTMKHIYDKDARVTWKMVLQAVYYTGNVDMFISAATYLAETRNIEKQDVYNIMNEIGLPKTYQEEVMTLADSLRQEGRQQGIQEGRQEGIQRGRQEGIQQGIQKGRIGLIKELIAAGLPIEQVAIATKATPSEVEQMLLMDV